MDVSSKRTDGNYTFENDQIFFRMEVIESFVWGRGWLVGLYKIVIQS